MMPLQSTFTGISESTPLDHLPVAAFDTEGQPGSPSSSRNSTSSPGTTWRCDRSDARSLVAVAIAAKQQASTSPTQARAANANVKANAAININAIPSQSSLATLPSLESISATWPEKVKSTPKLLPLLPASSSWAAKPFLHASSTTMSNWKRPHEDEDEEHASQQQPATKPRSMTGLSVADLLTTPSTSATRPKSRSLGENPASARPFASTSFATPPPPPTRSSGKASSASTPPSSKNSHSPPSRRPTGLSDGYGAAVASTSKATLDGPAASTASSTHDVDETPAYQYAPVQQIVEGRENIEYILNIREQPKQSRMCGVGEKADRRPIDPAPIIQLRVVTHPRPVSSQKQSIKTSSSSKSAKALPQLRRGEPVVTQYGQGWEDKAWYLENPYYFMCAMLADADKDEELHLLSDGKTRYTTGSCVSCLYHLKDIDGSHQGFFVFPDLSIRIEGKYRLKLCLFETIGTEVHHCRSIYSDPFMVYTAKRFPGMEESTRLSRTFADQGLKVRVRKNPRGRRSKRERSGAGGGPGGGSEEDELSFRPPPPGAMVAYSQPKRLRSDSWLSSGSAEYPGAPAWGSPTAMSPQASWSGGPTPVAAAGSPASHHGHWQQAPIGASHDPRRTSLPTQSAADDRYGRPMRTPPPWPPVNQMPPPPDPSQVTASTGGYSSRGAGPSALHAPPPQTLSPARGDLVSSRQRSSSSAAAFAPRPWESRGHATVASRSALGAQAPVLPLPAGTDRRGGQASAFLHQRERSLSDPRRMMMPPMPSSQSLPRLPPPPSTLSARDDRERVVLPPLGSSSSTSPMKSAAEHARQNYGGGGGGGYHSTAAAPGSRMIPSGLSGPPPLGQVSSPVASQYHQGHSGPAGRGHQYEGDVPEQDEYFHYQQQQAQQRHQQKGHLPPSGHYHQQVYPSDHRQGYAPPRHQHQQPHAPYNEQSHHHQRQHHHQQEQAYPHHQHQQHYAAQPGRPEHHQQYRDLPPGQHPYQPQPHSHDGVGRGEDRRNESHPLYRRAS